MQISKIFEKKTDLSYQFLEQNDKYIIIRAFAGSSSKKNIMRSKYELLDKHVVIRADDKNTFSLFQHNQHRISM